MLDMLHVYIIRLDINQCSQIGLFKYAPNHNGDVLQCMFTIFVFYMSSYI